MGMDYKSAGVNVEAGYESVALMKEHVRSTFRQGVLTDIGGFGGMFSLAGHNLNNPVLVSGTDGVGTKLKIAFAANRHDTVGIDCVAMCVNDIVCCGAEPLFFLDYLAVGRNVPERVAEIVKGVADGCKQAGCALIGGETAEMPGFYTVDEYDLAGFAVGIADRDSLIDGARAAEGDAIIGLASSGLHSNGFSLVRKVFEPLEEHLPNHEAALGRTLAEELLTPTRIYVPSILKLKNEIDIKGISHITGGGFVENLPRMLPEGLGAAVEEGAWNIPPVFELVARTGGVDRRHMYNTFNMGIGMALVVSPADADKALALLNGYGEQAWRIGRVTAAGGVDICLR